MALHGHKRTVSRKKAKKILKHGEVRGKSLTKPQKGLFGLIAGGKKPTRIKKKGRRGA